MSQSHQTFPLPAWNSSNSPNQGQYTSNRFRGPNDFKLPSIHELDRSNQLRRHADHTDDFISPKPLTYHPEANNEHTSPNFHPEVKAEPTPPGYSRFQPTLPPIPLSPVKPSPYPTSNLMDRRHSIQPLSVPFNYHDPGRRSSMPSIMHPYGDQRFAMPNRSDKPYARTPQLKESHKLAERRRRKEMKDLFDELKDELPMDKNIKASKWEIMTKALEYISELKATTKDMNQEIKMLKSELVKRDRMDPV